MNDFNHIEECPTTMEAILPFLKNQPTSIVSLYTFNQTQGKGQYGNRWETPINKNIAFSLGIPASFIKTSLTFFNFHTALLIQDYLSELTDTAAEIKWPNDTIVSGKKVSGFIIEKRKIDQIDYYIIGIGLNVNHDQYEHLPKAGSLLTATGKNYNLHHVAEGLFEALKFGFTHPKTDDEILELYNKNLFKKDKITVFKKNEIRQNGIIKYADKEGYLWIELEQDGLQKFYHKEIEMLY